MENKENQPQNRSKIIHKINKLSISKLYFKMNPLHDPKIRLKLVEDLFLSNCIKKNLSQRDNNAFSEIKRLKKYNIKELKYAYDFSTGISNNSIQNNINANTTNIINKNTDNILITSLKKNKYLKINNSSLKYKNYFTKKNNLINKGIQTKLDLNKFKCNLNKIDDNKKIKKNLSLNYLDKNFSYESENNSNNNIENNKNNYINNYNFNYGIKKYYKSRMILPKITKKYIMPSFENNKSKEIKDIFYLKQYQMKEIEESLKLRPFVH